MVQLKEMATQKSTHNGKTQVPHVGELEDWQKHSGWHQKECGQEVGEPKYG